MSVPNLTPEERPALPVPNLPLLRKVLDHIDAHPEEWQQATYGTGTACGTAACIAGHAMLMSGYDFNPTDEIFSRPDGSIVEFEPDEGQTILGITYTEASLYGGLFDSENTRADVQRHAEAIAARAGERL